MTMHVVLQVYTISQVDMIPKVITEWESKRTSIVLTKFAANGSGHAKVLGFKKQRIDRKREE